MATEVKAPQEEPLVEEEYVVQHLDRDPNDPRNAVPATPNLSNLNAE